MNLYWIIDYLHFNYQSTELSEFTCAFGALPTSIYAHEELYQLAVF